MGPGTRAWGTAAALFGAAILFSAVPSKGLAGPVANVVVTPDYDKYAVTYDLKCAQPCPVFLRGSLDGGKTFDLQMEYVMGDVGESVSPGKNKRILWDAAKDFPQGVDSLDLTLDVVAACAPPSKPGPSGPVTPVRTNAEYLADIRGEIIEIERILRDKRQELEDIAMDNSDLKARRSDLSSDLRSYEYMNVDNSTAKKLNKKASQIDRITDQVDSNRSRQDSLRRMIREYEDKLTDLKKEEREVSRGGQ